MLTLMLDRKGKFGFKHISAIKFSVMKVLELLTHCSFNKAKLQIFVRSVCALINGRFRQNGIFRMEQNLLFIKTN